MTYNLSKTLLHLILRLPKNEASFLYFTLESNEGLCFYSTLDTSLREDFRDVDIKTPLEWSENLLRLIQFLQKTIPIEIIKHEQIQDLD